MGERIHLLHPLMRRVRHVIGLCATLVAAGCVDFADPLIPIGTSPAQLNVSMRAFDQGVFQVDGFLLPGTDSAGFQRPVESPFIVAGGFTVEPKTLGARGMRNYSSAFSIPPNETLGPYELVAPVVRDAGTLPVVRLWGLQRIGGDTVRVGPGADIELRFEPINTSSIPANVFRQWFIEVRGSFNTFRISADGLPPTVLRIPRTFIPATATRAEIFLVYFQSASVRSETSVYSGSVVLDVRMDWVALLEAP